MGEEIFLQGDVGAKCFGYMQALWWGLLAVMLCSFPSLSIRRLEALYFILLEI
jgi:hypothetical protein